MKISLTFSAGVQNLLDCLVQVSDERGTRQYLIDRATQPTDPLYIDVYGESCSLTLTPQTSPTANRTFESGETVGWMKKLEKATGNLIASLSDLLTLRVACTYQADGLQEGDRLHIELQDYTKGGTIALYADLMPLFCVFFEVSQFNERFPLVDAHGVNRKQVIRSARVYALVEAHGDIAYLFAYPLIVGNIKRWSRDKQVRKTLMEFNRMDEIERQRVVEKQERWL